MNGYTSSLLRMSIDPVETEMVNMTTKLLSLIRRTQRKRRRLIISLELAKSRRGVVEIRFIRWLQRMIPFTLLLSSNFHKLQRRGSSKILILVIHCHCRSICGRGGVGGGCEASRGWQWCGLWHIYGRYYRGIEICWWHKSRRCNFTSVLAFHDAVQMWKQKWRQWWRYIQQWLYSPSWIPFIRWNSCRGRRRWGRIPRAWWVIWQTYIGCSWMRHPQWRWWRRQYWRNRCISIDLPP